MAGRISPVSSAELAAFLLQAERDLRRRIIVAPAPFGLSWPGRTGRPDGQLISELQPPAGYRIPRHRRLIQTNALNRFAP